MIFLILLLFLLGISLPLSLWLLDGWMQYAASAFSLWLLIGDLTMLRILFLAECNGIRPVWRDWWAILWCILLWPYTMKVWDEEQ